MILYEVMCIAMAVYWEARGEPLAGRFAVAEVVINRMHDPRYPSDACSVVYDGGETPSVYWHSAQRVAQAVYEGRSAPVVGEATHYHALWVHPDWARGSHVVATIDNHVFYRGVK